ncbi:MAG: PAS domain S-box protein, partial [Planctomycetaceae bacterium]
MQVYGNHPHPAPDSAPDASLAVLRSLIDHASDAVALLSEDGRIELWNSAAESLFGWPRGDALDRGLCEVIAGEDQRGQCRAEWNRFRAEQNGAFSEPHAPLTVVNRAGRSFDVELTVRWLELPGSRSAYVAFHAPRADPHWERQCRELTELIENAAVGMNRLGPDGTILWSNRAERTLLGYDEAEYVGRPLREFFVDPGRANEMVERLSRNETIDDFEADLIRRDRSVLPVMINANALVEDGRFLQARCIMRDVTQRRKAEEESRRLAAIVESSEDAIISIDLAGRIESWNPGATGVYGYSAEEMLGRSITELALPERAAETTEMLARLRRGEPAQRWESLHQRGGNRAIDVALTVSPIRHADGRTIAASVFVRDITAQKQAERRLEKQALEANLLHQATTLAAETDSFEEALESCVDIVCQITGWPVGHVFLPHPDDPDELISTNIWHDDDHAKYLALREATDRIRMRRGVGLPGRIWQSGAPVWITNVHLDPNFPRARVNPQLPIKGAFGFPIKIRGGTAAVLEFFAGEEMEPDPTLLRMVR